MGAAVTNQNTFRFREDDGNETGASWIDAQGSNINRGTGTANKFRVRNLVQETNNGAANVPWPLWASYNGGSYFVVTTTSSYVQSVASGTVTDDTLTTAQLTFSGSFVQGRFDSNGAMENNTILKSQYSEMEYCVFIVNDDVNNGDTIDFRTYETVTAPADSYTATGRVTVTKAASSNLTVDDAYVTTQVDPVSTTKSDTLVIADASIEPNADNVITTKSDTLVIADASVETQVDAPTITEIGGAVDLTVDDAYVTTQVDAVQTTKSDTLVVDDVYVETQTDNITITKSDTLSVADLYATTQMDSPTLIAPQGIIIEIHLEEDLSEFTSTVTDGGDLYWSADAALAGTSGGMACLVDDTNAIYGEAVVTPANTSGVLRWRVYLDPNSLTMADGDVFYIAGLYNSSSNEICGFQLRYYTAGGYQVRGFVTNDSNTQTVVNVYITDAPHYIEMMVTRSDGGDNGAWSWWIDGDAQTGASNLDNDTFFANFSYIRIGAIDKLDTGTHDTFYLDELIVNDDGSEIGPVSGGNNLSVDNAYVTTQVDPVSTTKSDTLIVSDISVETQIDNVAVTKSDTISISDSSVDTQVDHVSTTKSDTLVVSNVYVETYVDAVEINSAQFLSVDDAYIETQVDQISISKSDTLVVANTYTDTQVDEVSITKSDTLVIADAYSTTQVDSLNLSGSTTLSVDNAYVTTQSDNVEVQKSSSLSVDNAYVETQTDNVTVTSSTTLSVNNTYVTTQVDGLSVTKSDTLIISDSYVTTQVDSFAVSSLSGLAIDNVYVIPALDNLVVVQHQTLVIDDAEHGNTTDGNLVFIQYQSLSIDETVHDNYTDGPILPVQHQTLVIADTEHGQESEDGLVFIQYQTLAIDDTEHANYTDGPVLIPKTLTIQEALHGHLVDYIVFDGYDVVGVQTSRKLYLGAYRRIRSFGNRM